MRLRTPIIALPLVIGLAAGTAPVAAKGIGGLTGTPCATPTAASITRTPGGQVLRDR